MYFFYSNVKVLVAFCLSAKATPGKIWPVLCSKISRPIRMHDLYASALYAISHKRVEVES